MSRKRRSGSSHRKKPEVTKSQSEELIYKVLNNKLSNDMDKSTADLPTESDEYGDYLEYEDHIDEYDVRSKKCDKCNKCKHNSEEICYKYDCYDCNFACESDKELLIRIICLLINKEYGLKAIEQKIRKNELNDDIKNIKSITDLLERAIVGLGETAIGAVKKAVDAAGTMTDITSGLAKIAAGAAGTAGSAASTANGLANVASGTAGTAGAAAFTTYGLTNTVAGTAGTAGAAASTAHGVANVAAGAAGTAGAVSATAAGAAQTAAGAATAGAVVAGAAADIAAEAAGVAAAGAATVGVAGDIAAETAGLAAAGAATVGAAADIVAEEASTAAAISSTQASIAQTVANEAATAEAISSTKASIAETAANTAATSAAVSGTLSGAAQTAPGEAADPTGTPKVHMVHVSDDIHNKAFTTGPAVLDSNADTIQVWVLNNNSEPTRMIDIIVYNLSSNPKTGFYMQSSAVPANSSVFFTIASVPAAYELQIRGLTGNIIAYAVLLNKKNENLSLKVPVEARILFMYN